MENRKTLANAADRLEIRLDGNRVCMKLTDLAMGFDVAGGPCAYRAVRRCDEGSVLSEHGLPGSNLFNLSDQARVVEGSIAFDRMGLNPDCWYVVAPKGGRFDRQVGTFVVGRRLAPWSAQVVEVRSIETRFTEGG